MKFLRGSTVYYLNHGVRLIAELDGDESVIEIPGHTEEDYATDDTRVIVKTSDLRAERVNFDVEHRKIEREFRDKMNKEKRDVSEIRRKTVSEMDALKKRLAQYEGLNRVMDILEGKTAWAVSAGYYSPEIYQLSEGPPCSNNPYKLSAIVIKRDRENKKFEITFNSYHDGSGSGGDRVILMETYEQAVAELTKLFLERSREGRSVSESCVLKHKIEHPEIKANILKQREQLKKRTLEEIQKREAEVAKLKEELG